MGGVHTDQAPLLCVLSSVTPVIRLPATLDNSSGSGMIDHYYFFRRPVLSEENKALTRRFVDEVINQGNLDVIDKLMAPDYVEHNPFPGQAPGIEGLKQMFAMMRAAFPDLHSATEDMIAEGDKVVMRAMTRGTHKGEFMGIAPTGKQITMTEIHIIQVRDGKGVAHWGEGDALGMMQQLGVVPTE